MLDRRFEHRLLCSDLVDIEWKDKTSQTRRTIANLEDISLSGACLQLERPIPLKTPVRITYPKGVLNGVVRYCVFREIGYFLGVEFEDGCRWSQHQFRPQHLLDPRKMVIRTVNRRHLGGHTIQ